MDGCSVINHKMPLYGFLAVFFQAFVFVDYPKKKKIKHHPLKYLTGIKSLLLDDSIKFERVQGKAYAQGILFSPIISCFGLNGVKVLGSEEPAFAFVCCFTQNTNFYRMFGLSGAENKC